MNWFMQILSMLYVKRTFTHDEVLNAENENDLYDHTQALAAMQSIRTQRHVTDNKMRIALMAAQLRATQSAELERCIKQETTRVRAHH